MADSPVTLITGGGSGIGAATARQLLGQGHRVTITGRGEDRLRRFAEEVGEPADLLTLPGDAAEYDAVRSAVEATVEKFGRLDIVVANAGYATFDNVADGDPDGWRGIVLTNVLGPALLIRAALPALKETRGRIILVGSVPGIVYSPLWGNQVGGDRARREHQAHGDGDGIGVTLINPGAVETNFFDADGGPPDRAMLTADLLASSIVWAIHQPRGVDVNTVTVRPRGSPL